MKKFLFLIVVYLFTKNLTGQTFPDLIIKDVNVIPITKDTVLIKKSVAILNGKIVDINEYQKIKKSSKTKIIDGTGQFLMPGLTEMHIHLPEPARLDTFITTVVAAGVTHLRVMYSKFPVLQQRKIISEIAIKPKVYYPYLLTTQTIAGSAKQIDSLFNEIKKDNYDFIKMYSMQHRKDFNDTVFDLLMTTAHKNKMIVCGHFPGKIKLSKVLSSGFKSIEHLAGYVNLPDDKIEAAMALTKQYQIYNCPTLDWDVMSYDLPFPDGYHKRLVMDNAPKSYIDNWDKSMEAIIKKTGNDKIVKDRDAYVPEFEKKVRLLKRLNETGNLLILGGENGNLYQLDGFNMFEEMVNWSKAGISNFEILKSAIYNPARFFNEEKVRGTVEIGKEANLIMLKENPLSDIKNIKSINCTILNGSVYYKAELLKKI